MENDYKLDLNKIYENFSDECDSEASADSFFEEIIPTD